MLLPWQLVDFKDLEPSMQSQELLKQGHLKVSSARTSILQQLLDATAAFALGLKLFGETLLENRQHPLFEQLLPQFGQFMKHLKHTLAQQTTVQE